MENCHASESFRSVALNGILAIIENMCIYIKKTTFNSYIPTVYIIGCVYDEFMHLKKRLQNNGFKNINCYLKG